MYYNSTIYASSFVFQSHTILLVQPNQRPETRTYSDYESVGECLEGKDICFLIFPCHAVELRCKLTALPLDLVKLESTWFLSTYPTSLGGNSNSLVLVPRDSGLQFDV